MVSPHYISAISKQNIFKRCIKSKTSYAYQASEKTAVVIITQKNKASQAIQSPRTVPFFLLVSLLDGYSFPNVLVKGIVAFKH